MSTKIAGRACKELALYPTKETSQNFEAHVWDPIGELWLRPPVHFFLFLAGSSPFAAHEDEFFGSATAGMAAGALGADELEEEGAW